MEEGRGGRGREQLGEGRSANERGLVRSKKMMSTCCPRYITAHNYFKPLVYLLCLLVDIGYIKQG